MANLQEIIQMLVKHLPGGESNIKSIYLKSTDSKMALPIYVDFKGNPNEIKVPSNLSLQQMKKKTARSVKRLKKKTLAKRKTMIKNNKPLDRKLIKKSKVK
jgi:hypothetical protein